MEGGHLIPGAGPHRFQVAEHLDRGAVRSTWMAGERGGRERGGGGRLRSLARVFHDDALGG